MEVTNEELLRIRDAAAAVANPPGAFPSEAYDAACEKWDREVNAVPMRIEALCDELLMLRASVRLQEGAPGAREEFLFMAPQAKFPLRVHPESDGRVIDSEGRLIALVDYEGPDVDVEGTAHMIVLAVNTCAGFRAEPPA